MDLKAKLLRLPLCRLLGQVSQEVRIYGSGGFTSYDNATMTKQLGGWVHDLGIPRVEIKISESWGTEPDRDVGRIRLARKTIGEHAELYVDANGGYTRGQAVRIAEAIHREPPLRRGARPERRSTATRPGPTRRRSHPPREC